MTKPENIVSALKLGIMWKECKDKTVYTIKDHSGPGGLVVGYAVVFKPIGNEDNFSICNDKAFKALKELK